MENLNLTIKEIRIVNLQSLLEESQLSKTAFALKVKTSPAYLSQVLSLRTKRDMGNNFARNIECEFHKPVGWMDRLHPPADAQQLDDYPAIGVLHQFQPPAGQDALLGLLLEQNAPGGQVRISHNHPQRLSRDILQQAGIDELNACCLFCEGNSMEPVLPDGARLALDTANTQIRDGDIYAIDHRGSLRVRLVYKLPGGGLRLRSYNSEEWPDEHYPDRHAADIKILGRVFWWEVVR